MCCFLAECFVASFIRMRAEGSGPGGWQPQTIPVRLPLKWSTPEVRWLNECAVEGRGAWIDSGQSGFYLHIDDGIVLADGASAEAGNDLLHDGAESLEKLGFRLSRFKTGTPARIDGRTIDYDKTQIQPGDEVPQPFSFLNDGSVGPGFRRRNGEGTTSAVTGWIRCDD